MEAVPRLSICLVMAAQSSRAQYSPVQYKYKYKKYVHSDRGQYKYKFKKIVHRVAEVGSLSARAKMAIKTFVKYVFNLSV